MQFRLRICRLWYWGKCWIHTLEFFASDITNIDAKCSLLGLSWYPGAPWHESASEEKKWVKWHWKTKSPLPCLWAPQLCPSLGLILSEPSLMYDCVDLVGCTMLAADACPAPMFCGVFLRPRSVMLLVPKIRSSRWGKFLHTSANIENSYHKVFFTS